MYDSTYLDRLQPSFSPSAPLYEDLKKREIEKSESLIQSVEKVSQLTVPVTPGAVCAGELAAEAAFSFCKGVHAIFQPFTALLQFLKRVLQKAFGEAVTDFSYIDFGMSFGAHIWGFIDYPAPKYTGVLNEAKMGAYLSSLFSQMKAAGQSAIVLSFAQLSNIANYSTGNFAAPVDSGADVIASLLMSFQNNEVSVPGSNPDEPIDFLKYFVNQAHQNGVKVQVAFGGAVAWDPQFKILQEEGETYVGKAQQFAQGIQNYGIDGVDFDIEDPTALSSQGPDGAGGTVLDFFKTLHSALSSQGKTMTLTTMLGAQWRTTFQQFLPSFASFFDGLNLMAYSDTQFWLDPNTPPGSPDQGWTIEEWIDAIGKENAGKIHIGFDDGVPYSNPAANGGQYRFDVAGGSTDGEAAGQIYLQLLGQLKKDGYSSDLGAPFFWPDAGLQPNGQGRYNPTSSGGSNFVSSDMQDFYQWIETHS